MQGTLDGRANLAGKVAVVTGGAGGLGEPISLALAECGVSVAVCDRDAAALAAMRSTLPEDAGTALYGELDVRDQDALDRFFGDVDDRFGGLDILINVPGGGFHAEFLDTRPRGWEALIAQNFTHVLHACHLAGTRMRSRGGGSIVSVTSIEGHRAAPMMAVYSAMKATVTNLTRTLSLELAPHGIRVNTVAPDVFPTPATIAKGWNSADGDSPRERMREHIAVPLGRWGRREELANCVLFLASDLASYVTGTTLHVDGGTSASSGWFNWPDGYSMMPPEGVVDHLLGQSGTS